MNSFFRALLEAKGEKTDDGGATDYNASADAAPANDAPTTQSEEPAGDGGATDYNQSNDAGGGDDATTQDGGGDESAGDVGDGADGATDYNADAGGDDFGDGGDMSGGGDSAPQGDAGGDTEGTPEDKNFKPEDAQKNQVLYQDFCYFFEQINRIEKSLSKGSRRDMLTTQVYSTVSSNISRLKNDMFNYMTELFVGRTYAQNLYQFNSYIEALRLNIQMLKKIGSLNANS